MFIYGGAIAGHDCKHQSARGFRCKCGSLAANLASGGRRRLVDQIYHLVPASDSGDDFIGIAGPSEW